MLKLYDLPWKITLEETFIRRWLKQNKLYLLYLAKDILSGQGRNGMEEETDVCLVSSRGKACGVNPWTYAKQNNGNLWHLTCVFHVELFPAFFATKLGAKEQQPNNVPTQMELYCPLRHSVAAMEEHLFGLNLATFWIMQDS